MAQQKPAATAQTNSLEGSVVQVQVSAKRKVTYVFNTAATKKDLTLPYAVAVNGKVLKEFDDKPRQLKCSGGKIELMVNPGSKVALLLNSDAHPSYRKHPVYEVTPDAHDVLVTIIEKLGKHGDPDTPVLSPPKDGSNKAIEYYVAPLTGGIWMKVSHKYTTAEAASLIPPGTDAVVRDAVLSIYKGLPSRQLAVTIAAADPAPKEAFMPAPFSIAINFEDADNPKSNITGYTLLGEGLPRVHPLGYVALLNAARDANVTKLRMNSGWRPLLGSIAHRAGLGLDVDYLEGKDGKVQVNRQQLRDKGPQTDNVSQEEKKLFREYEAAKVEVDRSKAEHVTAQSDYRKGKNDPVKVVELKQQLDAAEKRADNASATRDKAKREWNKELDKNEPVAMRTLRTRLERADGVSQLFDPWYMDANTKDDVPAKPNEQRKEGKSESNETLHAHHLHITVNEPKIL
ncbi:hypothetical protein D3870_09125 [Noviherbaspirillum cavernae]|uniref:Uncharacterized protein n=1 Tax=Noviherbaspirillum cavernae TaxID=2320862 RepID=A0A418X137_9BURK|nr:hypothetical protein [Noviherbaspirillum cavernae]RJG06145.1 hypothetical protein D3870_09125 [Noviherbaspirillum cavernae]